MGQIICLVNRRESVSPPTQGLTPVKTASCGTTERLAVRLDPGDKRLAEALARRFTLSQNGYGTL